MKVLVTGGLGVNGAFVTRELVGRGHSVVIVDRRRVRNAASLGPLGIHLG